MSNLHPGGYRGPVYYSGRRDNRLFTAEVISRACNQALKGRDADHRAHTSIAAGNRHGGAHEHRREIARRSRA